MPFPIKVDRIKTRAVAINAKFPPLMPDRVGKNSRDSTATFMTTIESSEHMTPPPDIGSGGRALRLGPRVWVLRIVVGAPAAKRVGLLLLQAALRRPAISAIAKETKSHHQRVIFKTGTARQYEVRVALDRSNINLAANTLTEDGEPW